MNPLLFSLGFNFDQKPNSFLMINSPIPSVTISWGKRKEEIGKKEETEGKITALVSVWGLLFFWSLKQTPRAGK